MKFAITPSDQGAPEQPLMTPIARACVAELARQGHQVKCIENSLAGNQLSALVKETNNYAADYAISPHSDSPGSHGILVLVSTNARKPWGDKLGRYLADKMGVTFEGAKLPVEVRPEQPPTAFTNGVTYMNCVVELLGYDNAVQAARLKKDATQIGIWLAEAIIYSVGGIIVVPVPENDWTPEGEQLRKWGIMEGLANGTMGSGSPATRQQIATMFMRFVNVFGLSPKL
jgi:hypothetical protein